MKRKIRNFLLLVPLFLLVYAAPADAHAPRLLTNDGSVIAIDKPDISQAFYGELKNGPASFSIHLDKAMDLYVSILVPDVPDVARDKSVWIKYDDNGKDTMFWNLDGKNFAWRPMNEQFGGDNYFQGPEITKTAQAGDYFLTVFNPGYTGKYVLMVGQKESFSVTEIVNTIFTLPSLKKDFFARSPWTAYFNLTGVFMLIGLLVLIIIYLVLTKTLTKIFVKKPEPEKVYPPSHDLRY